MSHDDIKVRQGNKPYQTGDSRKWNIENSGERNHFVDSSDYSQAQITVDGSELEIAAPVLNSWIVLNGESHSPLSSFHEGIKFGTIIPPAGEAFNCF